MSMSLDLEIRRLRPHECEFAAGLIARAFLSNPTPVKMFGPDPVHRYRVMHNVYRAMLPRMRPRPISAWHRGQLVGVLGAVEPGACRVPVRDWLLMAPRMLRARPAEIARGIYWQKVRDSHDLDEPHWHLEPGGVEPALFGMGIGTAMVKHACEEMDRIGGTIYGLTERSENVGYYERFGGEVIDEVEILGVMNWGIRRLPGS
jgi:ribosomal protein S18 acetylase RimI-like enzyme